MDECSGFVDEIHDGKDGVSESSRPPGGIQGDEASKRSTSREFHVACTKATQHQRRWNRATTIPVNPHLITKQKKTTF